MKKIETPLKDLFVIEPQVFGDDRGFFYEFYNKDKFEAIGITDDFKQGNYSRSAKGVLRGIHFQNPPKAMGKLVRCTRGRLWDVAVDLRKDSPTYKQWFGIELSDENKKMLYVPPGFGHGFYALEDCDLAYLTTNTYDGELDANIAWDDPEIGIDWPIAPTLSGRDQVAPLLKDTELAFLANPMKVLVTGANGMLGKDVVELFEAKGHTVVKTDREELDITNQEEVLRKVKAIAPDVIINTAAYNFVDNVESDEFYPIAYAVNAEGPRNLALAAKENGIRFVHYSTDYVFDGEKMEGYTETDDPKPISRYGETKAAGEKLVKEVGGDYYICRTSRIFGEPGLTEGSKVSFVALMLGLAKTKPALKLVADEYGCPTYTPDLAQATYELLEARRPAGVYHIVNSGGAVSWYEFCKEFFELEGVTTPFEPVPTTEFPRAAKAPKRAELKNTKLPPLRHRTEALKDFLKK